jgi:sodium-independent sulfate anion transporter 11
MLAFYSQGIAALIEDFNKRKQPIYFYNPRPSVVSVFKGASLEEFVHFRTQDELEFILQCKYCNTDICLPF